VANHPFGALDDLAAIRIIARRRSEVAQAAEKAVKEAITPLQARTAEDKSKQNFAHMASLKDSEGKPLVDPEILAKEWVTLPVDLTQFPEVAETVLNAALGKMTRQGKRVSAPSREPVFSESPGGGSRVSAQYTDNSRKLGLTEKEVASAAKTFNPQGVSVIGEW